MHNLCGNFPYAPMFITLIETLRTNFSFVETASLEYQT